MLKIAECPYIIYISDSFAREAFGLANGVVEVLILSDECNKSTCYFIFSECYQRNYITGN